MLVQFVVAAVGSLVLASAPKNILHLIDAVGDGATLTVVAEMMLPEATSGPVTWWVSRCCLVS